MPQVASTTILPSSRKRMLQPNTAIDARPQAWMSEGYWKPAFAGGRPITSAIR